MLEFYSLPFLWHLTLPFLHVGFFSLFMVLYTYLYRNSYFFFQINVIAVLAFGRVLVMLLFFKKQIILT